MKLLLYQNLSWKLVEELRESYPESEHIRHALSTSADDQTIWDFDRANGFTIVTKDDDFVQRSLLLSHPPKVIWIRLGNCKTEDVAKLLANAQDALTEFVEDEEKSLFALP